MNNRILLRVSIATVLALLAGTFLGKEVELFGISFVRIYDLIGHLFLNALTLVVVPLVASSIITGTARVGKEHAFGRLGSRTLVAFVSTGLIAVSLGMALTLWIQPGSGMESVGHEESSQLISSLQQVETEASGGVFDKVEQLMLRMVPSNILAVAASGQMLGLICFSVVFGVFASRIDPPLSQQMIGFWQALFQIMMRITELVMRALPLGVFGLVASVVATSGLDKVKHVALFVATDLAGMLILMLVIYPLLTWLITGRHPLRQFRDVAPALVTAFSTSSTAATLPVTMECMEKEAKVPNSICSFTLPLGTSLNLTGTALHAVTAVLFVAQSAGVEITMPMLATVLLMGLFTSMGMVAGIPSGSLVTILVILQTLNIPTAEIMPILLVERLLDMCRTTVSVYGNTCCTLAVAR